MGRVTKTTIRALLELINNGEIKASSIHDDALVNLLLKSQCIKKTQITKSRSKIVLLDEKALRICCRDHDIKMRDLESYYKELENESLYVRPSEEIRRHGEDHLRKRNLWKGFFLKSDQAVQISMNGKSCIAPAGQGLLVEDGTKINIADVSKKRLWVVENYECFLDISWLKQFGYNGEDNLVICRWPLSAKARNCYTGWPVKEKKYFGDYDLAGINIFQTEFAKALGSDSFFIPSSFAQDIKHGSSNQFSKQKEKYKTLKALNNSLDNCLKTIIKEQKGLSQEYYLFEKDVK